MPRDAENKFESKVFTRSFIFLSPADYATEISGYLADHAMEIDGYPADYWAKIAAVLDFYEINQWKVACQRLQVISDTASVRPDIRYQRK